MAMTTTERVRAVRERRRRREIQVTVVLHRTTWGRSPAAATRARPRPIARARARRSRSGLPTCYGDSPPGSRRSGRGAIQDAALGDNVTPTCNTVTLVTGRLTSHCYRGCWMKASAWGPPPPLSPAS
jgi:hypothetical protein